MTCQEDCRYAEPLPRVEGDWLWCAHPVAAVRVVRLGRDCLRFTPRHEEDGATPLAPIDLSARAGQIRAAEPPRAHN